MYERPWAVAPNGVVLTVRLTPKARQEGIDGIEPLAERGSALKARVRAAPVRGAANATLLALIAKATGVAKRQVTLLSGSSARTERLQIAGQPAALSTALEKICVMASQSR